ncbi:hypothetical protein [Streptomyces cacaoi]|uniref:hypothetical protein n=1 Tax=Streptomyces cacaoi TaxID=1898 RepID=UPI0011F0B920|nr:hypothetical protein [Streptomyces cacaoi]
MSDDAHQPLPPEQPPGPGAGAEPAPPDRPPPPDAPAPPPYDDGGGVAGTEWWRSPPPSPPSASGSPAGGPDEAPAPAPPGPDAPSGPAGGAGVRDWWRGDDVREEWRDAWATHGQDGVAAAQEIGAHIGEAISSRLPDPHAAAGRRGLDLRWLRLKVNVPAVLLALGVTWSGRSATDRMLESVAEDGLLAPLGAALFFVLLVGVLLVLPVGSILGSALSHLGSWLVQTLVSVFGRAWKTPGIGYVLRVLAAMLVWAFVFAVVSQIWRGAIHVLTGA